MIDLHTHSLFSDGELIPSELVRRVEALGYEAVAITDHADSSSLDFIIPRVVQVAGDLNRTQAVRVIPGVELTHIPPVFLETLVRKARELGAKLVVVHGETIVEPVAPGTNRAALQAGVDVLAHPGLLSLEDARLAADKGIFLEITGRKGHSLTNGHVARLAQEGGAELILDSDTHAPEDIVAPDQRGRIVEGAGLNKEALQEMDKKALQLFQRLLAML